MDVRIVTFPETRVASITHLGAPKNEHATALKLVAWKRAHGLLDQARHRTYGLHSTDPRSVAPDEHRVEFCLSIDGLDVAPNPYGIVAKTIPRLRCALARDVGSRRDNQAAVFLYERWLPSSGETPSGDPLIFHYVNVGPSVKDEEAITDVYLPLRG
jgi:AraC family transcriptional regulator